MVVDQQHASQQLKRWGSPRQAEKFSSMLYGLFYANQ
jgi:hypothetical protein